MYITNTLWNITRVLVLTFWTYRFWLLRFKISYMHNYLVHEWMFEINTTAFSVNQQLSKWRNSFVYKYHKLIFSIINIICIMYWAWSLTYFWFYSVHSAITTIFSISYDVIQLIFFIALCCLYKTIPTHIDVFYVKGELFWLLIALAFIVISTSIAGLVWHFVHYTHSKSTYGLPNMMKIVAVIGKFMSIMVSTKLVIHKLHKLQESQQNHNSQDMEMMISTVKDSDKKPLVPVHNFLHLQNNQLDDLRRFMSKKALFEVFLKYLANENKSPLFAGFSRNCAVPTIYYRICGK